MVKQNIKERKIFVAFEWNDRIKPMYEYIFGEIAKDPKWAEYAMKLQYGAESTSTVDKNWMSDITPDEIEKFIQLNKQLYKIFVERIAACDLFIADITGHNPNVMLELGIAIQHNKNILVVTSQDIKDMVFDIRGLHAFKYSSKKKLKELIEKHINIYNKIKGQTFEKNSFLSAKRHSPELNGLLKNKEAIPIPGIPRLKNIRIKVKFRFLYSTNQEYDWFGVNLRTQGPWRYNSELILIRFSGKSRSLTWPEVRKDNECFKEMTVSDREWHTFEIEIDEKRLTAFIDKVKVIEDVNLTIDAFGEIWLACLDHHEMNNGLANPDKTDETSYLEVGYKDIDILSLDTTTELFREK